MKKVACIVKGYPRLSETFIAQEIHALEQAGVDIQIYSLRHPTDAQIHPIHKKIQAKVHYLPEYLYQHPIRVLSALVIGLFNIRFYRLLSVFIKDLKRDFTANRVRRFGQALVLAREIDPTCEWLYVHFLHTPASVAFYTSALTELPWSCSAHAKDIWTSPKWEIQQKLVRMQWLVTCTQSNVKYLQSMADSKGKVSLLYHGLDLSKFSLPITHSNAQGKSNSDVVHILSVGRAVNKKGYDILLEGLSLLPDSLHWQFSHIGGGPQLNQLKQLAQSLNINHRISWLGAQNFEQVNRYYSQSDIFVLASRINEDGDRDGLPNVLMEAMANGLPCIATEISGIPELIIDQKNGILVPPENSAMLSNAMLKLIQSVELRRTIGLRGNQTVKDRFSLQQNIQPLIDRFK